MIIKVPATSANLGCGFDSCGIALSLYLEVEILEEQANWEVLHSLGDEIPTDENNLIIKTALCIKEDLQPHKLRVKSEIPLTRGLGSSSSAIIAGIELANILADLQMSEDKKIQIATRLEGHPDNVVPAIMGSFVISSYNNRRTEYVKIEFPETDILAYVPNYELETEKSRKVLPKQINYKEAVTASSIANVMIAALINKDLQKAGRMMESDLFHEKYRKHLVPELLEIRDQVKEAYCAYLSGAGSTIIILCNHIYTEIIKEKLEKFDGNIYELDIDKMGVQVQVTNEVIEVC